MFDPIGMRRQQQAKAVPLNLTGGSGDGRKKAWWFDDRPNGKDADPKDNKDQGVSRLSSLHFPSSFTVVHSLPSGRSLPLW
jgi:hypothetical protein